MNATDLVSFLALRNRGNGYLTVHTPNNDTFTFAGLDLDFIAERCPVLACCFEKGTSERKLYSLYASSVELVSRFLRFLYTDDYHVLDHMGMELPCSLLMHAQLYYYGELYDVRLLPDEAYNQIHDICELAFSMPTAPADLCETLRYLYQNAKNNRWVHDRIVHYCVSCFVCHRLGENEEFKKLLAEVKAFQQDLYRINMERGFSDEGSSEIIQMQLPNTPQKQEQNYDYVYDMFGTNNSTPMQTPSLSPTALSPTTGYTLVHRPRRLDGTPATEDSDGYSSEGSQWSDLENFSLVGPSASGTNWFENPRKQRDFHSRSPSQSTSASPSGFHSDLMRRSLNTSNPFIDEKHIGRSLVEYGQPRPPFCTSSELPCSSNDIEQPANTFNYPKPPLVPFKGLAQASTPAEEGRQAANQFDDFPDGDESDSERPLINGQAAPSTTAESGELPIRSISLYSRPDLSDSTETVVAISDGDIVTPEESLHAADDVSSDSEWSLCSDGSEVPAPT